MTTPALPPLREPLQIWFETLLDAKLPLCRYPNYRWRKFVRWALRRGSCRGQELVFLNLIRGLDRLGVAYVVNDYGYARRHPEQLVCLLGKPHLLRRCPPRTPLLFGAVIYSHPSDDPTLLERHNICRMLVPGGWMRDMCEPYWGARVHAWPVGIDTDHYRPEPRAHKDIDVLIYDKLRHLGPPEAVAQRELSDAMAQLRGRGLRVHKLDYGFYREQDYRRLLQRSKMLVYCSKHETQGIAYLQALSTGVPVLAWNGSGVWEDPDYYPHRVVHRPVTAVPYWDARCGSKKSSLAETLASIPDFLEAVARGQFAPRDYVLENLTLESAAQAYLGHVAHAQAVAIDTHTHTRIINQRVEV